MDRFDESFHSCPIDGSDASNDWTNIYSPPWPYSPILFTNLTIGEDLFTNLTIRVRWIDSTNLSIRVRWTNPTNLTIGRIFTAYLSLMNVLRLIHQSYHSCPMDRFDESFHSCPNPTNETICVRWTEPDLI